MSYPTGPWRSECIIRGWSGVLAQSRESDPWEIWSLALVLSPGQSVPTPSPHTKWNGGGSFDADLGGIPILPGDDQSRGWSREAGASRAIGGRGRYLHTGRNGDPSGLDHGGAPWKPTKPPPISARRTPLCESGAADVAPSGRAHAPEAARGGIQHSGECQGLVPARGSWAPLGVPFWGVAAGGEGNERSWLGDLSSTGPHTMQRKCRFGQSLVSL